MIKKLFFLSLIIYVLPSYAMKRFRDTLPERIVAQHTTSTKESYYYEVCASYELLEDIQDIIIDFSTHNTIAKKPKEATDTVYSLAQTNKRINALINNPTFSDNLINNLSQKFNCSHETIARFLGTPQAKKRLELQRELKLLCFTPYCHIYPRYQSMLIENTLSALTAKKINLEFTYNHGPLQKTPLMISMDCNTATFELLLRNGANINGCNAHGLTPLTSSINFPINRNIYKKILDNPQVAINQQNKRGDSALLHCLIRRLYCPRLSWITENFTIMIRRLLKAGADPELANRNGITPLDAARWLRNEEVIDLIQHAIDQKHAPIQ